MPDYGPLIDRFLAQALPANDTFRGCAPCKLKQAAEARKQKKRDEQLAKGSSLVTLREA